MMIRVSTQKPLVGVLAGLVTVAWLSLWIWGQSPYGRFLSHEELGSIHLEGSLALIAVFVAGWTLMTVAMMLPTTLPLVMLFHAFTSARPDRLRLLGLLLAGYLSTWALFGVAVHLGDLAIHDLVARIPWLEGNQWVISSLTVITAGVYQFTPLKYHCLDKCRSPLSFISEHWRGRRERVQSFLLGVHHGIFCIGCCWALMLLMFAVGVGSVGWMLVLGAIMAVEKNMPWGRRLSTPLGVLLLGLGIIMLGWGSSLLSTAL